VADEHERQMKSVMQTLIDSNALFTQQALRLRDMCRPNTMTTQVGRKKNFGGNGRDRRTELKTPSWLSHAIWAVFMDRATVGWTVTLRAYSIVPHDSAIFKACERGDTSRMNQLFDGGFASPFDENEFGMGIFEVSVNLTDEQTRELSFARWLSGMVKATLLISFIAMNIEH
jgi:hypothetical protein